jgi:hypothetical protein
VVLRPTGRGYRRDLGNSCERRASQGHLTGGRPELPRIIEKIPPVVLGSPMNRAWLRSAGINPIGIKLKHRLQVIL